MSLILRKRCFRPVFKMPSTVNAFLLPRGPQTPDRRAAIYSLCGPLDMRVQSVMLAASPCALQLRRPMTLMISPIRSRLCASSADRRRESHADTHTPLESVSASSSRMTKSHSITDVHTQSTHELAHPPPPPEYANVNAIAPLPPRPTSPTRVSLLFSLCCFRTAPTLQPNNTTEQRTKKNGEQRKGGMVRQVKECVNVLRGLRVSFGFIQLHRTYRSGGFQKDTRSAALCTLGLRNVYV